MLDGKQVQGETLTFDVATAAIKGAREYQEDSLIANFPIGQSVGFAVLADGMWPARWSCQRLSHISK